MANEERPPLGLTPKFIWNSQRINAIKQAIQRYLEFEKEIPFEWIEEFNKLIKEKH